MTQISDIAHSMLQIVHSVHRLIWSVCSTFEEESRRRMDNWIREHEGIFPLKDTVYDYYVDERLRVFKPWEDRLPDNWRFNPA